MDFNGNLLTRCGKTYLRAFIPWIAGIVITYSVLISSCFALYPYGKQELIKPE